MLPELEKAIGGVGQLAQVAFDRRADLSGCLASVFMWWGANRRKVTGPGAAAVEALFDLDMWTDCQERGETFQVDGRSVWMLAGPDRLMILGLAKSAQDGLATVQIAADHLPGEAEPEPPIGRKVQKVRGRATVDAANEALEAVMNAKGYGAPFLANATEAEALGAILTVTGLRVSPKTMRAAPLWRTIINGRMMRREEFKRSVRARTMTA